MKFLKSDFSGSLKAAEADALFGGFGSEAGIHLDLQSTNTYLPLPASPKRSGPLAESVQKSVALLVGFPPHLRIESPQ